MRSPHAALSSSHQSNFIFQIKHHPLNQSFNVLGHPTKRSSASGAPQLAHRSTKSQIGMPTSGRRSAVQNPQKVIHKSAILIGFIKINTASTISKRPIKNRSLAARPASETPNWANQPIQSFLPCNAKTPCPINSPATATRKTQSTSLIFINLFYYLFNFASTFFNNTAFVATIIEEADKRSAKIPGHKDQPSKL